MRIRRAKRNPIKGTTTFYVRRTPQSRQHIVQRIRCSFAFCNGIKWFCDCKDFMCRKLPFIFTNSFSGCVHIVAVKRRLDHARKD